MNNPKSVSEDIQAFVNKLKDQGYYFDIDSQEDAESVWQIIDEFYKQGIQEGRRLERAECAELIKNFKGSYPFQCPSCDNDRSVDIYSFQRDRMAEAIQSRNEGSASDDNQ